MSDEGFEPGSWQPRTAANKGVQNMRIMIMVMDGPGKGVVGLRQRFSGTDRVGSSGCWRPVCVLWLDAERLWVWSWSGVMSGVRVGE